MEKEEGSGGYRETRGLSKGKEEEGGEGKLAGEDRGCQEGKAQEG